MPKWSGQDQRVVLHWTKFPRHFWKKNVTFAIKIVFFRVILMLNSIWIFAPKIIIFIIAHFDFFVVFEFSPIMPEIVESKLELKQEILRWWNTRCRLFSPTIQSNQLEWQVELSGNRDKIYVDFMVIVAIIFNLQWKAFIVR